ncbi:MAG: ABC transporter, permease protein 2 (cluster 1, maltose/g3p/polyamine/iron) [uncultured Thermoleophilia bacterium]|uniref:ABC transporter, permease protein 2 (Cluster 1, maltose/g3p/polyamine/iron) n=1 Tax=uncultured Thermoleophilia bacterium TaxID=1497501 RepID=A0A6J4TAX0_9ACTN|nr:MAG: ABC transporter, permease protein 2 (cluster 1, maltose/g3p/polyamine/iron) [uncultured Thermoleophilia bacterium]
MAIKTPGAPVGPAINTSGPVPVPAGLAPRPRRRRTPGQTARHVFGRVVLYAVLTLGSLIFIAPLLWMVSASLQDLGDIFSFPPHWIPIDPSLDNYRRFLFPGAIEATRDESANILRWFGNGLFVAGSVTVLQLFFCSLAAYAFAKRRFRGRDRIFLLFLATMMIPAQVTLIPWYIILRHIPLFGGNDLFGQGGHGWLDSYYGLIIPGVVSAWTIFFLRQYMRGISDEYLDAARVDGASEFRVFWTVVLPLTKPALGASGIFTFIYVWEDLFGPLILISNPDLYTVPLGMALFSVKNRPAWDLLMAGGVLATIPVLIVFVLFQRQLVKGITLGGIKG